MRSKENIRDKIHKTIVDSQCKSGGILASEEKDRYPFVFPRDCYFITKAMLKLDEIDRVKKYLLFLKDVQKENGEWVQRYKPNGNLSVTREKETDVNGLVLENIWNFYKKTKDKDFLEKMWPTVKKGVQYLLSMQKNGLIYGKHAIHENKYLEEGFEIWTNCWAVKGLKSAVRIASVLNKDFDNWEEKSKKLKKKILDKFWDEKNETFIKTIKLDGERFSSPDISMVSPVWLGLIPIKDKRTRKTIKYISSLWDEAIGGYHRFHFWQDVKDWHWYDGGDGSWSVYTLVMLHLHKKLGHKRASDCRKWIEKILSKGPYLPEHVSQKKDFDEWLENEKDMTPWIKEGVKKAKKTKTKLNGKEILFWAYPLNWPCAELIDNWEDEFL